MIESNTSSVHNVNIVMLLIDKCEVYFMSHVCTVIGLGYQYIEIITLCSNIMYVTSNNISHG